MRGARAGNGSGLRRLVARAIADDLAVFVVPDQRLARAAGLDPEAAGLRPVATPRHAAVLLLIGPIPEALAAAAGVAYAQMPRPRAILAAGATTDESALAPDVAVALDQQALRAGVGELRRLMATGAFAPAPAPFEPVAARMRQEYVCPMHPEIVRDEPGSCPICGMNLVAREALAGPSGPDHAGMAMEPAAPSAPATTAAGQGYTCPMHPEIEQAEPGNCPLCGMRLVPRSPAAPASPAAASTGPSAEAGGYTCPMHPAVVAAGPGSCPICGMRLEPRMADPAGAPTSSAPEPEPEPLRPIYTCPMHSEVVRAEPGRCPLCGMHLVPVAADRRGGDGSGPHHAAEAGAHRRGTDAMHAAHGGAAQEDAGHQPSAVGNEAARAAALTSGGESQAIVANASPHGGAGRTVDPDEGTDAGAGGSVMPRLDAMDHAAMGHAVAAHTAPEGGTTGPAGPDHSEHPAVGHAGMGGRPGGGHGAAPEAMDHAAMGHGGMEQAATVHRGMDHGGMDHGAMDHDMGSGFMSMVAVTKDLPRSRDGLPMEWVEAPFGPLFPGLPGGLALTFTLDGDGVTATAIQPGATRRGLDGTWGGPAATFPDRLARLDPLSPVAYRLLGRQAVETAAGVDVPEAARWTRIWRAEWERVRSHLGWLAEFAGLLGDRALAERAAGLQVAFARSVDDGARAALAPAGRVLVAAVRDQPLLRTRLAGVGGLAGTDLPRTGPVARAAGLAVDARLDDPGYQALGFAPVVAEGDDALARLLVRLAEVAASLDLLEALPAPSGGDDPVVPTDVSGEAQAAVETPRGAARLHLVVERGAVVAAHLETPTDLHLALIPPITAEAEVADALIAVASLDLSPWEHDR